VTLDAPGGGNLVSVAVPPEPDGQGDPDDVPFIPGPFQQGILDALDGRAMRTDALARAVDCDRRRLFKPGGLPELRDHGLADHHHRPGYYRPDAPPPKLLAAEAREGGAPRHSLDFRSVTWGSRDYQFTPAQAAVVKALWEAADNGTPEMGQETLLDAAGSEGRRLRDVFKLSDGGMHPAWGRFVVPGTSRGAYRLDLTGQEHRTLTDCERDVLGVIERAGRRLSGDEAKLALQEANLLHGDSTVTHALADLVQVKGLLTNRRDSRGKGYGLPEWCDG
jgi:hypothetical protein